MTFRTHLRLFTNRSWISHSILFLWLYFIIRALKRFILMSFHFDLIPLREVKLRRSQRFWGKLLSLITVKVLHLLMSKIHLTLKLHSLLEMHQIEALTEILSLKMRLTVHLKVRMDHRLRNFILR